MYINCCTYWMGWISYVKPWMFIPRSLCCFCLDWDSSPSGRHVGRCGEKAGWRWERWGDGTLYVGSIVCLYASLGSCVGWQFSVEWHHRMSYCSVRMTQRISTYINNSTGMPWMRDAWLTCLHRSRHARTIQLRKQYTERLTERQYQVVPGRYQVPYSALFYSMEDGSL
jgi:hypothetical protein